MASPAQKYRFNGLPEFTADNIEQLDEMLEDLYTYLTQSPLGSSDAPLDFTLSEIDTGLLYSDADEDFASLDTVGSIYISTDGIPAALSAATGNALISGGAGAVPSFGKIGLTTHVSGTLPIANGGTNNTTFNSESVLYFDGTKVAEDTTGLVFSASTNRLGIGAASPTESVTVTAATSPIVGTHFTDTSSFGAFRLYEGTTLSGTLQFVGSAFGTVGRRNNLELFNMHASGDITFHVAGSTTPSVSINEAGNVLFANMTAGSVLFAGTSGLLSQDNANLFWDDTNNWLGLGTAVPASRLHVSETADTDPSAAATYVQRIIKSGELNSSYGGTQQNTGLYVSNTATVEAGSGTIWNYGADIAVTNGDGQYGLVITNNGAAPLGSGLDLRSNMTRQMMFHRLDESVATNRGTYWAQQSGGQFSFVNQEAPGHFNFAAGGANIMRVYGNVGAVEGVLIGTLTTPGTGSGFLIFGDGTAPATMGSNTAGIYANDVGGTVEMFGIGEAGNTAQLTGLNIRKTADESVTNSTTHQADDHLTVNLAASSSYAFEIYGFWTTAGATAGITVQLDGTVGVSSLKADVIHYENSADTYTVSRITAFNSAVGQTDTGDNSFCIKGVIETSTAGTFFLEWAQNAADAVNATTLQENSYLLLRKLNA